MAPQKNVIEHLAHNASTDKLDIRAEVKHLVRSALLRRRDAIVYRLAERFADLLGKGGIVMQEVQLVNTSAEPWVPIESLSQLRAAVGGRFQNLKDRWVEAGFPLREHRGDRSERPELNQAGWVELVSWVNRQGFEARLNEDADACIFFVRKISK